MNELLNALQQGIAPALVVAIYLIVVKIIDNRKESKQTKLSSDLINSISTISNFIKSITENIINKDKDKCKNTIEDTMYSAGMRLINFVSSTIVNNHIDTNKENIISNVKNIVNTEYYTIYSTLSLYTVNNVAVSDCLDKSWINTIEKDILDIIYNNSLNKEDKILAFINKINLRFQSYITLITNRCIK